MKMQKEHFDFIKNKMLEVLANNPNAVQMYESGSFHRSEHVKDLQTRFSWDVFDCAVPASWVCDNLYSYLNDSHIKTALLKITKEVATLNKRY